MNRIRVVLVTLMIVLFSCSTWANGEKASLDLNYFKQLKFEVLNSEQNTFKAAALEQDYFWVKCILPYEQLGKQITLQISSVYFDEIMLYSSNGDNNYHLIGKSGNKFRNPNDVPTRFNQITFTTEQPVIYLKNKVSRYAGVDLVIEETNQLFLAERWDFFKLGGYYGLAIMSIVFNIVFYILFKDKRFIFYCFLLCFVFLQFFYEDGLLFFVTSNQWLLKNFVVLFSWLTAAIACVFTYHFLSLKDCFSPFIKYAIVIVGLALLATVGYFITEQMGFLIAANLFNIIAALWCCYMALKLFRKNVLARFLIATLGMVLVFGIGYHLNQMAISPWFSFFSRDLFRLVSALEIISISFAIIYDIKKIKTENSIYRKEVEKYVEQLQLLSIDSNPSVVDEKKTLVKADSLGAVFEELQQNYSLTERELQVLKFIAEGYSNHEISEELFVSVSTVKYHVSNLYYKLEIKSRGQAVKLMHQYTSAITN